MPWVSVSIGQAYVDAEYFFDPEDEDSEAEAHVGVEGAPRMLAGHVEAALRALMASVIATHGKDAWPWVMRH